MLEFGFCAEEYFLECAKTCGHEISAMKISISEHH